MKKLLLLITFLSTLIYAQIDISQFYTTQIAENKLTCQQIEKFVEKYSKKPTEVYRRLMDGRGNCQLELRVYKCPKLQENVYYTYNNKWVLNRLHELKLFIENCVDSTSYSVRNNEFKVLDGNNTEGFILDKIPDKKDIKWKKE